MRFLLLLALLGQRALAAPPCRQIDLATTAQKKALLREYIEQCQRTLHFHGDKGVVKLIIYQEDGITCWLLSALTDDRYRAFPPAQYARFKQDVILVYRGGANANPLPIAGDLASRAACIQEVVGQRVTAYVAAPQYTSVTDAQGNTQRVKITRVTGGNFDNEVIIKFNKDGTVSKYQPV
jgi:hypothetical protein